MKRWLLAICAFAAACGSAADDDSATADDQEVKERMALFGDDRVGDALKNNLTKVPATFQDFEALFLNSMFQQMYSGIQGEGPFGNSTGTGVWRSMLTEEYSKSFAKAGGIGVSNDVFRTMIMQQAARAA